MKTEFKHFINEINAASGKPIESIITFFVDNNWFGEREKLKPINGKIMLSDAQVALFTEKLQIFLTGTPADMYAMFSRKFPVTNQFFLQFLEETQIDEDAKYYLTDFLLLRLQKDLFLYRDKEMEKLVQQATFDLTKAHGDELTFFFAWLRLKTKTTYQKDYVMEKRYTLADESGAYSFDEYLQLFYYLFNEEYIQDNDMFAKAAVSKNYTDTWLYLAMYLVRPLRFTDMCRIYHPLLPYAPEDVLAQIKDGTFPDKEARLVLLSVSKRMEWLPLTPNKTADTGGVTPIVFDIPTSCETLLGKLFALAEAHRQIAGEPDAPIIRKINTYQQISRYMGEEIGELFLHNDFRSKSATKSYLQDIYMVADEVESLDGVAFRVKGYYLAALARSHKGSYGEFATTTFDYLKDAKFNRLTPQFIAFQLLERGVFSFMASMLLKMVLGDEFNKLQPKNQTEVIKTLDLSPKEIESIVTTVTKGQMTAKQTLKNLITDKTDALSILRRIGDGEAVSKQRECMCLISACNKVCPYANRTNCVGCEYEISTRSTFYLMIEEYNRIMDLYNSVTDPLEKGKYYNLAYNVILPKMDEMLWSINECCGEQAFNDYETMLKENI